MHPIIKKLQIKDISSPVLIIDAPEEYRPIIIEFANVNKEEKEKSYGFIQIFGTNMEELKENANRLVSFLEEDGLLWISYPKMSSKKYKGSDCSRDKVAGILSDKGYEPVSLVALDEDWSALRLRKVENIKKMARKSAITEEGKKRIENN